VAGQLFWIEPAGPGRWPDRGTPRALDGSYRTIRAKVDAPDRPVARTDTRYYATPEERAKPAAPLRKFSATVNPRKSTAKGRARAGRRAELQDGRRTPFPRVAKNDQESGSKGGCRVYNQSYPGVCVGYPGVGQTGLKLDLRL